MRISDWSSDVCSSDLMLGATCHELDLQPLLENAGHYTDQNDHAQIRIVPAIHEHSLQRRCAIALRCRDLRDDLFEYLVNADAGFGGSKHRFGRVKADNILYLMPYLFRLRCGQVDLVDDRHDLMVMLDGLIDIEIGRASCRERVGKYV